MAKQSERRHANPVAEMMLLAILYNQPSEYSLIETLLTEADFTEKLHKTLFQIFFYLYQKDVDNIDREHIFAAVEELDIDEQKFIELTDNGLEVDKIIYYDARHEDILKWLRIVKGESYKRALLTECRRIYSYVDSTKDDVEEVIETVESTIVRLGESTTNTRQMGEHIFMKAKEVIAELATNPLTGVDLGFPIWQKGIGQLRNRSVHFFVGYTGTGKSQMGLRAAMKAAKTMPVIYLDTEMDAEIATVRGFCIVYDIPYDYIDYGWWKKSRATLAAMGMADELMDDIERCRKVYENKSSWNRFYKTYGKNFVYLDIRGTPLSHSLKHVRRLILTKVRDRDPESRVPQCFLVVDQIKLQDPSELAAVGLQEFQYLGVEMSKLHDFANDMNIPVLALGQTNAGGEVEGAKRLKNTATSVTIMIRKDIQGFREDPQGNYKFVLNKSRRGGLRSGSHINYEFNVERGRLKELGVGGRINNGQPPADRRPGEQTPPENPPDSGSDGPGGDDAGAVGTVPDADAPGGSD